MTDRITNLILKAQVDQSAADAGIRALQQLQANADEVRDSFTGIFKGMSNTAEEFKQLDTVVENVRSTSDALDQATKATNTNAEAVANLNQKYIDAADAAAKLAEAQRQAALSPTDADFGAIDSSGEGGSLSGLSSGLRAGGTLARQAGLGGLGDTLRIAGEVDRLGISLGKIGDIAPAVSDGLGNVVGGLGALVAEDPLLAASLGVIAVGITALIATNAEYEKSIQAQKDAISAELGSQKAYYQAVETLDTAQAKKKLEGLQADQRAQNDIVKENTAHLRDQITQAFPQITAEMLKGVSDQQLVAALKPGTSNLLGIDIKANDALKQTADSIAAAQKAADDADPEIRRFTDGIAQGAFKAGDAITAEKKLQDERDKSAEQSIAEAARLAQLRATGTSKGVQAFIDEDEARKVTIQQQLADASKLSTDEVKKLKDELKQVTQDEKNLTDSILPAVQAREAEDQAVKDATKAFDEFTKSLDELSKVTAEIGKLEADRTAQINREKETDKINAQRLSIEMDFQARIDAAKREESEQAERDKVAQADANAQTKYNDDKTKIDANFFDSQLKTYQNYIDTEKQSTDRANLQRLQTLEKAQLDLKGLAASGDVAGFVSRSQQAKLDLEHQAQNESAADKQRREQFDKQTQAAEEAHQKQLNDLQVTFDREKTVRDTAAADRIAQIENSGKEANTKSAQLERELNDIREQWRRDDLKRQRDLEAQGFEERLHLQEDKQREILGKTGDFFDQWVNDIAKEAQAALQAATQATASNTQQSQPPPDDPGILQFATGLDYVPRNNYRASLDLGERVLTARQNVDYTSQRMSGSGLPPINVQIDATVGDIASKTYVDSLQVVTVEGIKEALRRAKGKGLS